MRAWADWVGRTQSQSDVLTPGLLARFRATIDSAALGDTAGQAIHWCLCLPDAATAGLDRDGHPMRGGFLPPVPLPRRMWASSTVSFVAPIAAGTSVHRHSTIVSVTEKQGGSGPLVFVEIGHKTFTGSSLCIDEVQTIVYRDAAKAAPTPAPADADPDLVDWTMHRRLVPGAPLLFRYSALTFNSHRIHYDLPYAQQEEGYRGLVVHGPLIATLLLDLAARHIGDNGLSQFSFRAQSPAFADEALHLVGRTSGTSVALAALGSDGRTIMSAEGRL